MVVLLIPVRLITINTRAHTYIACKMNSWLKAHSDVACGPRLAIGLFWQALSASVPSSFLRRATLGCPAH